MITNIRMETILYGLFAIIIVLLILNLLRSRPVPKIIQEKENPIVVVDRPYYYDYPLYSYGVVPWWNYYGGYWPYGYGSGGYSGGIWTGGGGHRGSGHGGHGGGGGHGGHGGGGGH